MHPLLKMGLESLYRARNPNLTFSFAISISTFQVSSTIISIKLVSKSTIENKKNIETY